MGLLSSGNGRSDINGFVGSRQSKSRFACDYISSLPMPDYNPGRCIPLRPPFMRNLSKASRMLPSDLLHLNRDSSEEDVSTLPLRTRKDTYVLFLPQARLFVPCRTPFALLCIVLAVLSEASRVYCISEGETILKKTRTGGQVWKINPRKKAVTAPSFCVPAHLPYLTSYC